MSRRTRADIDLLREGFMRGCEAGSNGSASIPDMHRLAAAMFPYPTVARGQSDRNGERMNQLPGRVYMERTDLVAIMAAIIYGCECIEATIARRDIMTTRNAVDLAEEIVSEAAERL